MPIRFEPPIATLSGFLDAITRITKTWQKKTRTWSGDRIKRKGEEERLWFRGQPAAAQLSPRIYRVEYLGRGREAQLEIDEPEIRQQFQSRAIQLASGHLPEPERIWDWYFLMQHYGAPTRLLDWTDLPLVSLYFAVTGGEPEEDAAVWVLDPYWLNHRLFDLVEGPLPRISLVQVYY
ncbi:FRG domain-containing protein [Candidatus Binatus soli]|uniref:FRG domain-containing protein n=1 Tax=Candidatus Binatus soli TaxID=1953413 RepID=UPI003D1361E9